MTITRQDGTVCKDWLLTAIPLELIDHAKLAAATARQPVRKWMIDAMREKLEKDWLLDVAADVLAEKRAADGDPS